MATPPPPSEINTLQNKIIEEGEEVIRSLEAARVLITQDQIQQVEEVRQAIERLGEEFDSQPNKGKDKKQKDQDNKVKTSSVTPNVKPNPKENPETVLGIEKLEQASAGVNQDALQRATENFLEALDTGGEAGEAAFREFRKKFVNLNAEIEALHK